MLSSWKKKGKKKKQHTTHPPAQDSVNTIQNIYGTS